MKTCRVCGKQFQSNVNNQTICDQCRTELTERYDVFKQSGSKNPTHCIICGKKIEPHGSQKKHYTCSPKCAYLMKFIASWKCQQRKKERDIINLQPTAVKPIKRLDQNIEAAKEAGLSYGIYMAKKRGQL
jgi:predicted nucleic acid-binding Zn ribbon protein